MSPVRPSESSSAGAAAFSPTLWSVVLKAGKPTPEATAAFGKLVQSYWYPVYAYVRRRGHQREAAKDLTQDFFVRLLEKHTLYDIHPSKGKFRTFLLTALGNFLANEWVHDHAAKRGGQCQFVSWEELTEEKGCELEPASETTPENAYDRDIALAVVARGKAQLQEEYRAAGRARVFEALEPYLTGDQDLAPYMIVAQELGLSADAVKVAIMRLRRRYGEALRAEVAEIVAGPEEIDDELRHLSAALFE